MAEARFVPAALERFWELREREGRSHELRHQLEAILEREGARAPLAQLQELLVLMLYWGTALDVREIAGLRKSQIQPAEMGRFKVQLERRGGAPTMQVLSAETSAALRLFLNRSDAADDLLLRDAAGRPWAETELYDLVQRNASGLLLGAALIACIPPAIRAMRVDPVEGLRAE